MSDARSKDRASLIFYLNAFSFDIMEVHIMQELNYIRCGDYYIPDICLGEYRKLIRNGLNHYSHCTPEQTKWNLYRHQVSDNTFVLKLNFNKAIITINAYYIDRYLCVHLCDIIDIVLSSFSDFLSKNVDAQKTLVTLREACEKIVTDFLKDIDDDK